jgi:hypothetical protein
MQEQKTKIKEFIGQKYSKLTITEFAGREKGKLMYKCKCECGGEITTAKQNITSQSTRNCGCVKIARSLDFRRAALQKSREENRSRK